MNGQHRESVFYTDRMPCTVRCVNREKGTNETYILKATRDKTGMLLNKPEKIKNTPNQR